MLSLSFRLYSLALSLSVTMEADAAGDGRRLVAPADFRRGEVS